MKPPIPLKFYIKLARYIEFICGVAYWTKPGKGRRKNRIAGSLNKGGYIVISCEIDGVRKSILASRLSYYIANGNLPLWPDRIDHIDKNKLNNDPANLRIATCSENNRWRIKQEDCSSIYIGVDFKPEIRKWRARFRLFGTIRIFCGLFDYQHQAARARDRKILSMGCQDFSTLNFPESDYANEFIMQPELITGLEPVIKPSIKPSIKPLYQMELALLW